MNRKKSDYYLREKNPINRKKVECVLEKKLKMYIHEHIVRKSCLGCIARPLAICDYLHLNLN